MTRPSSPPGLLRSDVQDRIGPTRSSGSDHAGGLPWDGLVALSQWSWLLSQATRRLWHRARRGLADRRPWNSTATSGRSSRTGVTSATARRRQRKANLRLDQESSSKSVRDGRRAIAPGDLDASELYRRITAEDDSERMPPVKSGKTLSAAEIERIGRWIAEGAKWQPHWAFIVPKSPPAPHVRGLRLGPQPDRRVHPGPPRTRGAAPASEAERGILIRRVTLDLTGLPPTRAEILAFENDAGPNAYEKVVDRLLGSPASVSGWPADG